MDTDSNKGIDDGRSGLDGIHVAHATLPVGDDGCVNEDIPCIHCGYNLRTLHREALCPECSTPVGRSLRGDFLQYSDPDWVQRVAGGATWLAASLLLGLVLGAAGFVVHDVIPRTLSAALGGLASFIAYWLLTAPEPRIAGRSDDRARLTARICAVIKITLVVLGLPPDQSRNLAMGLGVLSGLVTIVQLFAVFIYLRRLAVRIPDLRLARSTVIVMWGFAGTASVMFVMTVLTMLISIPFGSALFIGLLGGVVVFAIWNVVLLLQYRRALRKAAARSRQNWPADCADELDSDGRSDDGR